MVEGPCFGDQWPNPRSLLVGARRGRSARRLNAHARVNLDAMKVVAELRSAGRTPRPPAPARRPPDRARSVAVVGEDEDRAGAGGGGRGFLDRRWYRKYRGSALRYRFDKVLADHGVHQRPRTRGPARPTRAGHRVAGQLPDASPCSIRNPMVGATGR